MDVMVYNFQFRVWIVSRLSLFLFSTLYLVFNLYGQDDSKFWILDRDVALSFEDDGPAIIYNNFSDYRFIFNNRNIITARSKRGDVVFYGDSNNIYNSKNERILNGSNLRSGDEPYSICLIAVPNFPDNYYWITIEHRLFSGDRIKYSRIYVDDDDAVLNSDSKETVVPNSKGLSYVVGAYNDCNDSYWVLSADLTEGIIYSYPIMSDGIFNPIKTSLYQSVPNNGSSNHGGIIYNTSKKLIALFGRDRRNTELYRLNLDGSLSWIENLSIEEGSIFCNSNVFTNSGDEMYSAEFVRDEQTGRGKWDIYKYRLSSENISTNKVKLGQSGFIDIFSNMQLGPDNKVYYLNEMNDNKSFIGGIDPLRNDTIINFLLPVDMDSITYIQTWGTIQNPVIYHQDPKSRQEIIIDDHIDHCFDRLTTVLLESNVIEDLLWSTGDTTSAITIDQPGIYTVEAVTEGCTVRDTIEVLEADDCPIDVNSCNTYLPNAISLSSMRGNDSFMPVSNCELQDYRLEIYDRWGGRIYQSTDPSSPWDGTSGNYEIQSGVYSYAIRYRYNQVDPITFHSGTVTVVR